MRTGEGRASGHRLALEAKANAHFDLELQFAVVDRAANILHFKPIDIAQGLARLAHRVAHSLMDAVVRNTNDLDDLVGLVRHKILHAVNGCFQGRSIQLSRSFSKSSIGAWIAGKPHGERARILDRPHIELERAIGDAPDHGWPRVAE